MKNIKIRANSKHMDKIFENATNIVKNTYKGDINYTCQELTKYYKHDLGVGIVPNTLHYYGNGEYLIHTCTGCLSFNSIIIKDFETKLTSMEENNND